MVIARSNLVEIWRIKERKLIWIIPGLKETQYGAHTAIFSPDTTRVTISSDDQWLIYDIKNGSQLKIVTLSQNALPYWDGTDFKGYELPKRTNYFPAQNAKAFRFIDRDQALSFPRFIAQEDGTLRSEICRLSLAWGLSCQPLDTQLEKIDQQALTAWVGKTRLITPMALINNDQNLLYDASSQASTKAGLWNNLNKRAVQWSGFLTQWSISGDTNRLAIGLHDNGMYHIGVINLATGKSLYRKDFQSFWALLDLAPDGNSLAVLINQEDTVRLQVIDLRNGKVAKHFDLPLPATELDFVSAVEYGPAGDFLALANIDGWIEIRSPDGKLMYSWQAHQGEAAIAFSQDGRLLATNSRGGWIKTCGIKQ